MADKIKKVTKDGVTYFWNETKNCIHKGTGKVQESTVKAGLVECYESMGLTNSEAKIAAGVEEKILSKDIDWAKFSF